MFRKKRTVPGINSSSTADIAFLLLIFFLITSSMGTDEGLTRRLPPPADEQTVPTEMKKRNVLQLSIEPDDRLKCGDEYIGIEQVRERAKEFIANPQNDAQLPERIIEEIPLLGPVPVTKNHVISLYCNRNASYSTYIAVQNELVGAYKALRDELAQQQWQKRYADLSAEQQSAVRTVYPQRISETSVRLNQ